MRGSREISLVPSLHRASTDALISVEATREKGLANSIRGREVYTFKIVNILKVKMIFR